MTSKAPLPDLGQSLAPLLQRISVEQQPLFIAYAERLAAQRYRSWAAAAVSADRKHALLACAAREDEIASRVESLYPDAVSMQREILNAVPELGEAGQAFFAPFSMDDQFALQAKGERLGAATWRSLAKRSTDDWAREVFLACAILEEQSAEFLESIATRHAG